MSVLKLNMFCVLKLCENKITIITDIVKNTRLQNNLFFNKLHINKTAYILLYIHSIAQPLYLITWS